jgi:FSR family fosmidomycin resistance protein-like MFS transporter
MVWSLAHAVNDGYPSLYLALLPVLMARWHFGAADAGLLAGLSALSTQAIQPVMGWWADRRGGPWFIVGGLLVGSLGISLALASPPPMRSLRLP